MRTQGAFFADTPHSGGFIYYNALNLFGAFLGGTISSNMALTRNAVGDYSFNRTAGGAETYQFPLGLADIKRLIADGLTGLPFQEQFGVAAGTVGYPAGAPGLPPFTGNTQLTAPTAGPPKGIRIKDVVIVYQVGVADLTSAAATVQRSVWSNNVALGVTNIPIAATAFPLTAAGDAVGPYVVTRTVTTPVFETTDLSDISLEIQIVMQNNGTLRFYGMGLHVDFNYD